MLGIPAQVGIAWVRRQERVASASPCRYLSSFTVTVVHSVHSGTLIVISKQHLRSKDSTDLERELMPWPDVTNNEMSQPGRSCDAESSGV